MEDDSETPSAKKRKSVSTDLPSAEIGLEEYVRRSQATLSDGNAALELIHDIESQRQKLRDALISENEGVKRHRAQKARQHAADALLTTLSHSIQELQNLNTLTVELAQQGYDAYDQAIDEIDARIRLLTPHVELPIATPLTPPPTNAPTPIRVKRSAGGLEPRYCFCRGVASGEMICCDNSDCPIEWFHFACLDPKGFVAPSGAWLCPQCRHITF